MRGTAVIDGARTPFGKSGGSLRHVAATRLGAAAIRGAVERSGASPEAVDSVIMGMVVQAGAGQIPA